MAVLLADFPLFSPKPTIKNGFVPTEFNKLDTYVIENIPSDNCINVLKATELYTLKGKFYGV